MNIVSRTLKRCMPTSYNSKVVAAVFLLLCSFVFLLVYYARQVDFMRLTYLSDPVLVEIPDQEYEDRWKGRMFSRAGYASDSMCRFKTVSGSTTQLAIKNLGVLVMAGECQVTIYPDRKKFFFVESGNAFFIRKKKDVELDPGKKLKIPLRFSVYSTGRFVFQGKTLLFKIRSTHKVADVYGYYLGRRLLFFPKSKARDTFVAIQGVDLWQRSGDRLLTVRCVDENGDWLLRAFRIEVIKKRYRRHVPHWAKRKKEKSSLAKKKKRRRAKGSLRNWWRNWQSKKRYLLADGRPEREYKMMQKIYRAATTNRLWRGPFIQPMKEYDRISSVFGLVRYLSIGGGSPHRGTDYAADKGALVRAAASGKVVFARFTPVRGKLVVIDHGMGVFTSYLHMSRIYARLGMNIKKGTPLGAVGTTGLSTGPHLHFEVRTGNVCVDPTQWFGKNILFRFPWYKLRQDF